jgi:hypothetical protein
VNYINAMVATTHTQLGSVLAETLNDESNPDFWKFVKFQHVAPAVILPGLTQYFASYGLPPETFDDWAANATWNGVSLPANWVSNASSVGQYGGGTVLDTSLVAGFTIGEIAAVACLGALVYFSYFD